MRATVTRSPVRHGKQKLLTSCAIAAGIAALAYGGPTLAQVNGNAVPVLTGAGSSVNSNSGTNTTTVTVTQAQSIYNWVPTDTAPTGGAIDFLPVGENWNFIGTGDYTVLNRFVNGGGGSLSREIALNGTVNSYVGSTTGPRGGNIWFYNAGGILIGATGVINVGSLVLTSNDIVTTGGLFGPGGTIRFNGTAGSTSAITVNGAINANKVGNPGGSYVALVAPRVVQAGAVRVDGSAAYVAAEVADIRINNGLFDINVTRGVEGGNVITHTGTTTGPGHQDGDIDQNRIYMVAIPKNDAVTMLVSGTIGYDDAVSATEVDGGVRLSAGYNVVGGELAATPANATAANITAGDTRFLSSTIARASNVFAAQPTQPLPGSPPPMSSAGQFFVEGSGTFIGDASSTVSIGANQSGGATGTFTVQSGGRGGTPGVAAVNVTGGTLSAPGGLTVRATGTPDAVTGNSQGGTASLTITGGSVTSSGVTVEANGTSDEGSSGATGDGRGGNASITVSNSGSSLTAGNIFINAIGRGDNSFASGPPAANGDGVGGTASLTVSNGGAVGPATLLSIDARGIGGIGVTQSGDGTGGTARIAVSGTGSFLSATQSFVQAGGDGGGSLAGFATSQNGGDGTGGTAEVLINTGASSTVSLGALGASALGRGGNASGSENASGGDALGGTAQLTVEGGVNAQFTAITLNASALAGNGTSSSGTTGQSGNARANNVTLAATGGSTIDSSGFINLFAVGMGTAGENFGAGTGGNVAINATAGGTITTGNRLTVQAMGGNSSLAMAQSGGNGVGGNVDFLADGGTIVAEVYDVDTSSSTVNVTGAGGTARGGTIDLFARNGGEIRATLDATNQFNASASSGSSAAGTAATGGTIQLIADGGRLDLGIGADLLATGTSGGAVTAGATATGTGGSILIRTAAAAGSEIDYGQFFATTDGRTSVQFEVPGGPIDTAGNGLGGTIAVDVQGGTLSGGFIELSANGLGSGGSANGTGGTATFTQTGGDISISDMSVSADGFGGTAPGVSGTGRGGIARIDLSGGTITAADIIASASGEGRSGLDGDDQDPANITAGGTGGAGIGGNAVINIGGTAIVDASVIAAYANGTGGTGGAFNNFSSFGGTPGTPGNGGDGTGGTANVSLAGGSVTASSVIADASGIGGEGGSSFFSSSSGGATGVGVGGTGGTGRGGRATIDLAATSGTIADVGAVARGIGGLGGTHNVGGAGGDGYGGIAQAIIDDFDAGTLQIALDSTAEGGNGTNGRDGRGGNGGNAFGGTSSVLADGANASVRVTDANFITGATGGNGGNGNLGFSSSAAVAPSGGNGGSAQGGAIEVIARDGAAMTLGLSAGDTVELHSTGTGGNGGNGSAADFGAGNVGGDGGLGGGGVGGSVRLVADGGTITTAGEPLEIDVSGQSGSGGTGGAAGGGGSLPGSNGGFAGTAGGRVNIEATGAGAGLIDLGNTNIFASGDTAGRVEIRSDSRVSFASLDVEVLGLADPTNNDTDIAPTGIFLGANGGAIEAGSLSLITDGSIGLYAQGNGRVSVAETAQLRAVDQVDIRHDQRGANAAPTLETTDDLAIVAGTSISAAAGSLLAAGGTLSLTGEGLGATIGVDRLDATDIAINGSGAASVEHAEAVNDFTASAGSFRTGLNSIITGGDITITSPGAVDLGNSSAGGFVQVTGQSIVFNNVDAGLNVNLFADGTAAGAEGIRGGSIDAGGDTTLFGNSIALTGTVTGTGSFFAFGTGGAVAVNNANVDGTISIFAAGNLTGTYVAGGNIFLNSNANINASAQASGGYVDGNGITADGNLFVVAAGDATLTNSSAGRMFGVNAGGVAAVNGGTAGEDILILAGTTANLTNVTGGDDITVRAPGNITALNVRTTGAGADTHILDFSSVSGSPTFTIGTGEGTQGINGADIVMASTAGAIDATTLSAGDDILLNAAGSIAVNGATTLGLGTTGGDSSIRTQGGATTLAGLDAFSDVVVDAAGLANLTGPVAADRDIMINAQDVRLATLTGTGGAAAPTVQAGGNVVVNSSAGIAGGGVRASGDVALTAATAIGLTAVEGQNIALIGANGIDVNAVTALGTSLIDSANGNIRIGALAATGAIDASAQAIRIESGGPMNFAALATDAGDAYVRSTGNLSVANANVAGTADLRTQGATMNVGNLTAANATLENTGGSLTLGGVTVTGTLGAAARTALGITGVVTGQSISLASGAIDIGSAGRVGTAGVTQQLSVTNNNNANQTFIGGTGSPGTYHLSADEMTRLYGTQIEIVAPEVAAAGGTSVGSAAPPDVIVDGFTMTGGASNSNLGANGALTIRTPGKMRVIGNVQLTGLTDANALNLRADDALEVILGQGSVRLVNGTAPAGQLNMVSADIIVATQAAITAVGAATTIDTINSRLAENDGIVLDEGALFARGIRANVAGGFYVQNSGAGTEAAQRRGLTFGAGGLDVTTQGESRIVINGVHLGPNGQVTGFDTIGLLTIGGVAPVVGTYDRRSTFNGCFIANTAACTTVAFDVENSFPVQDVIEEETESDDGTEGQSLPVPLITMRELDPLTGEPLLDDPVTGAGNDDLWTAPTGQ